MKRIDPAVLILIAALLVGALARLWDLGSHSLFLDEGFTIWIASKSWPDMMAQIVYHDFHPPVFYALTYFAINHLHWQVWDYRYLTAPFGLLTIVASWAIARRTFGDMAAAVTVIVVALEPSLIEWDRLYRMYSVMTALAALSWWLMLIAQEKRGRARWVFWGLYGLTAIAQPYVQYLGAVNVLCHGAYALTNPRKLWPVIASGVVAVLALVPWLWVIRIQYPLGGHVAGTGAVPIPWSSLVRDVMLNGAPSAWAQQIWFNGAATAFVLAVAGLAAWRAPRSVVPFWLVVAAVQIIATFATGKSLVVPRYLLPVIPAFAVALGGVVSWLLKTRMRVIGLTTAIAVPAAMAVCTANTAWDPYYQFTDWYVVNLVVLEHERRDDAMLFVQGFPYIIVGNFTAFRGHHAAGPATPDDLPYAFRWIQHNANRRIWYIENQYFFPDPDKKIKAYLDKTRRPLKAWSENKADGANMVIIVLYDTATKHGLRRAAPRSSRRGGKPVRSVTLY